MINEVTFTTFEEVRKFFDEEYSDRNENFVFRGHSNKIWQLVSTLNRLIKSARLTGAKQESIKKFTDTHLKRFKAEIKGRRGDNPSKLNEDEAWALGQHYGLATPLLDWSNSPYIALFFAFDSLREDEVQERCVWGMNKNSIDRINRKVTEKEKKIKFIIPETEDNKRIISQSGLFTKVPVMSSVDEWVNQYSSRVNSTEPALTKIVISGNRYLRKNILKHLELMNIKFSTIYPDLIGASKYCNVKAENYEV